FALAEAAADRGARVSLVTTVAYPGHRGVEALRVETAEEMLASLREHLAGADVLIMAAAVADFRPTTRADHKIRREETQHLTIDLDPVPDILGALAQDGSAAGVYMVGFAAEGADLDRRAIDKAKRKGLQAIVANDISRTDIGFASDYNEGVMFFADGSRQPLARNTKREMADRILDLVVSRLPH